MIHEKAKIHPSAAVDSTAHVSAGAYVGPNAKIGVRTHVSPGVRVGANAVLGGNVFVGAGADVGDGAHIDDCAEIQAGVHVGEKARIGMFAEINYGARLAAGTEIVPRQIIHAGEVVAPTAGTESDGAEIAAKDGDGVVTVRIALDPEVVDTLKMIATALTAQAEPADDVE